MIFDDLKGFLRTTLAKVKNQAQHNFREDEILDVGIIKRDNALDGKEAPTLRDQLKVTEQKLRELARIDAALDRLENGTFGQCLSCQLDIDIEDLTEDPSMSVCRDCRPKVNFGNE